MSGVPKKTNIMTPLSTSDVKSKKGIKNDTTQFWNNSISRGISGSSRSYLYNPFFNKPHETKESATPILLSNYLNSTKPVHTLSNNNSLNTVVASKKRNRTKPGPASRKKKKKKQLDEPPVDKNLHPDLISYVESSNKEKNSNSSSSTDTIILDSEDNSKTCDNIKMTARTKNITDVFSTGIETLNCHSDISVANNFTSQQIGKVVNSSMCPNNSSLTHNQVSPSSSVLKACLTKNICTIPPVSNPFKFFSNLGPLSTTTPVSILNTKAKKTTKRKSQQKYMYSEDSLKNAISLESNKTIDLPHSNVVENSVKGFQFYASMGLDEDLCDVKSHKVEENLNSNFVLSSSLPSAKEMCSQDIVNNSTNIPIKIEKDITPSVSPDNRENLISTGMLDESQNSLNKVHVDMTFETDPYDEEDDLPLSVLKSKVEIDYEAKSKCSNANASINQSTCSNIPVPLFIKKELIEDEIVSESQEILDKNIVLPQNSNLVSKVSLSTGLKTTENILNSNSASNFNLKVKIKSEPDAEFEYSDSAKIICPETLPSNLSNLSAKNSSEVVLENSNQSKKSKKGKQKNTKTKASQKCISPFSSNDAAPSTSSLDSCNSHETLNKDTATTLVTSKKKKVKKTPKHNITPVQLQATSNLNNQTFQDVDTTESSVLNTNSSPNPVDKPCTALDTNSNATVAENRTTSKKKGKNRKKNKKTVHLDENLPITLLIKRQKTGDTNTDGLDSFLCTNISKSVIDEFEKDSVSENLSDKLLNSAICNNNKNSELLSSKESLTKNLDNLSSTCQNSDLIQSSSKKKKKTSPKRKPLAKKRDQFGKFEASNISCEQNNDLSDNLMNILNNEKSESTCNENAYNSSNSNKETSKNCNGKDNTVVHMSFEEQHSPPYDSSEEFVNSILSIKKENEDQLFPDSRVKQSSNILPAIKNIKEENCSISESETCEQSKNTVSDEQNSRFSTPASGFSPELNSSNFNFQDVSNSHSANETNDLSSKSDSASKKKKKGKKRNNGWYKKKKQKNRSIAGSSATAVLSDTDFYASASTPISSTEFYASAAAPLSDTNLYASSIKQPVVVVKNLLPEIEKVIIQEKNKDYLNAESETVLPPIKKKRNSGKATKRKRAPSKKKSPNKKLLLDASESQNNSEACKSTVESPIQSSNSEKDNFENIPWEEVKVNSAITRSASEETVYAPFDDLPDCDQENEVIDISDSPVKTSNSSQLKRKLHSPLIDVAEIAQEIAGLENLVHSYNKQHNHETLDTIIPNSSERNAYEYSSKTSQISEIRNQPGATLCNSSKKHSVAVNLLHTEPQNINLIEPLAKIKKESDSYGTYETNNDSNLCNLSSFGISDTLLPVHNSTSSKIQNPCDTTPLINLSSIKTEPSSDSISYGPSANHKSKAPNTSINHAIESCITNVSKNVESFQLNLPDSSDKIVLSVKKEICTGSSVNHIRDVHNNAKPMTDDEIQILEVQKLVPCVDLTDEDASNINSNAQENISCLKNSKPVPLLCDHNKLILHGNIVSEKIHDETAKETNFAVTENKETLMSNDQNLDSTKLPSERNIFQSNFSDDYLYPSTEREAIDPFILRQKYINEYFRYPFPPSVASFHSKPQEKHKTYTRIHSQTLNLSIEKVESRLKNSVNSKQKFGNKLGDIVKLERYPVSSSEVECYHRILGIAPSHKLLSKCFKSPDKNAGSVLDEFSLFSEFQGQSSVSKFENKNPSIICSLQDIIQGISESRMMCNKFDTLTPSEVYKRDCPSIDTKDSCDSFTSSVSDRFANSVEKSDIKLKNSILKDDLINSCQEAGSSGRNSALSCAASDIQDSALESFPSSRNSTFQDLGAHSSDANKSSFSLILSNLKLPSKEELESLVNNESNKSVTNMKMYNEKTNAVAELEKEPMLSSDLQSLSNTSEQIMSTPPPSAGNSYISSNTSEDGNTLQNVNPVLNIDLPVTELRKILEVAGSLCLASNSNEVNLWKSKETFEYNHTQSFPVTGITSNQNLENTTLSSHISSVATVQDKSNSDDVKKDDPINENSDDDYVDNEPQYCESDGDKNETDLNENEEEEPKIPQYKSKWEKIMERKSLESEQRVQINEHLLKDCFPVSSKVPSKKCNVPNKISISAALKTPESKNAESYEKRIAKSNIKTKSKSDKKTESGKIKAKSSKVKAESGKVKAESSKVKAESSKVKAESDKKAIVESDKKTVIESDKKTAVEPDIRVKSKFNKKAKDKSNQKLSAEKEQSYKKGEIISNKTESKSKECKNDSKLLPQKKKSKFVDDASDLFVPDKPVKVTEGKEAKSSDINPGKRFYGNRITNRGTFLTESSSEFLSNNKIPKKKIPEISKKLVNVRSEEFHSMVKSPDIVIDPKRGSRYDRGNLIQVVTGKTNSYRIRKNNKCFDRGSSRNNASILLHSPESENLLSNRTFMDTQPSDLFHPSYHNSFPNQKAPLGNPLLLQQATSDENRQGPLLNSPFHNNDDCNPYRIAPVLNTASIAYPSKDVHFSGTKVPFMNIPSSTSMEFPPSRNILSSTSPPLTLLQNILSNVHNNSSGASKDAALPFSGYLNPTWNNNQYPSTPGQPYFSDVSDSMSDSVLTNTSSATDLPSVACNLVQVPPAASFQFHNQPNHSFDSSNVSSQFITPHGSNQISHPTKKTFSTCLVPQHLKSSVGHKTVETANVRLLMLEWSVDWLVQQQKFHDPPPIYKALKKVVSSYDSFEDYYNTYFPLMLLDTWHRIYVSWTHLSQASPYFCEISSYSVKSNFVSVECQTVFNSADHPKGVFPDEGSILMIKYGTKSNEFAIKILGYVTSVKTRRFNPVTDSKLCNFKPPRDGNFEILNVLTLTFMGAYNSEDIDKRLPIRIHVLCNVRSTLKQNDALLYISKSPLQRSILNPVEDGLLSFSLTPRNSPQDKVNECVRDITKGILSPHPLPLLTIVRAVPESDRLNIIPLLIEKMKTGYRTKVLLCVRTVRALCDIAANICLHESLKMVIINKRCDTGIQFHKYLLDELVTSEISKLEDGSLERHLAKNEVVIRTKKQIFSECDVVLSLIRNSHDEFMETTFIETESVAQMCCIVDEANLCTEPETLIPILHGISKLILIGDPDYPAKVVSKTAKDYDYNRSFFHRAYDLDLITE